MEQLLLKVISWLQTFAGTSYTCAKCENTTVTSGVYCDGSLSCPFRIGFEPVSDRTEHLHIKCGQYGYMWMVATADKVPA